MNCDKSQAELEALIASGKLSQQTVNNMRVPKFLIVGPVRFSMRMASGFEGDPRVFWPPQVWPTGEEARPHEQLFNKFGFRHTVGYTQKRKQYNCFRHCAALQKTCEYSCG